MRSCRWSMPEPRRRLDHVVIAVRDLDEATARYRALGFHARPGGRHTGRGTHNAIIRFGADYLELISVYDEAEARKAGRVALVNYLREREGLVAYALATDDIEGEARRLSAAGLPVDGPFAMERLRPDVSRLSWRLVIVSDTQYRRPWPFFIQWDQPEAERVARDAGTTHPNGAHRISGLTVGVSDLEGASEVYDRVLGLASVGPGMFVVEDARLTLEERSEEDEGPYEVEIAAASAREIPTSEACGARIRLVTG